MLVKRLCVIWHLWRHTYSHPPLLLGFYRPLNLPLAISPQIARDRDLSAAAQHPTFFRTSIDPCFAPTHVGVSFFISPDPRVSLPRPRHHECPNPAVGRSASDCRMHHERDAHVSAAFSQGPGWSTALAGLTRQGSGGSGCR